ncbi:MAG: HEPN domain-containing protein [Deltaproteobacteria bacterium]|nr:HEPN domain-containing protein [Deltaproteobacteria bacterium]
MFDISCFHSQQAAEKALKGYLVCHDVNPPKTHALDVLCKICEEFNHSFKNLLNSSVKLWLM